MRILGISLVKNEEDIIEFFVRYNLLIMDHLLVIDNGSTDGTLDILRAMVAAGLSITLLSDGGDYNQIRIMNHALSDVMHGKYGTIPDFIVPIDADECLVVESGAINPRELIKNLDRNTLHKVLWRTYLPSYKEVRGIKAFTPEGMQSVRDKEHETGEKLIIPTELVREGFVLNNGNHDAFAPYSIKKRRCDCLRMAHFPIRTPEQFFLKNVLGYYNRLSTKTYIKGRSKHIENAYYAIKRSGMISFQLMEEYCLNYCSDNIPIEATESEPFQILSIERTQLQYESFIKNNIVSVMLNDIERIISNYRASFFEHENTKCNDTDSSDIETVKAIEQYSFKKMRVERIKRDYYQGLATLYNHYLEACNSNIRIGEIIGLYDKYRAVSFGRNFLSTELETTYGIPVINSPIEEMIVNNSDIFDFSKVTSYLSINNIKTIFVFDKTRIEELRASAQNVGAEVVDITELIITLMEMRK